MATIKGSTQNTQYFGNHCLINYARSCNVKTDTILLTGKILTMLIIKSLYDAAI